MSRGAVNPTSHASGDRMPEPSGEVVNDRTPSDADRSAAPRDASALMALPDDDLVARMRDGDREAAAIYLLRRRGEIDAWLGRRVRDDGRSSHGRADLLSTLFRRVDMMVMRRRFQASDAASAESLVYSIAHIAMRGVFRGDRSRRDREQQVEPGAASGEAAGQESVRREQALQIAAIVRGLDPESFELLVGKLDGRSSDQLAAGLGCSPEAVRQRWKTLRGRLLEHFEG